MATVVQASRSGAVASIHDMNDVAGLIVKSRTLAAEAGETLKSIVVMVHSSADQVRTIATASQQQSAASEEINHSVAAVNGMANEINEAMIQATKAVNGLVLQAVATEGIIKDTLIKDEPSLSVAPFDF